VTDFTGNWVYGPPVIVATLDYEGLLADRIAAFLDQWDGFRAIDATLPEYDVEHLESDPAVIGLEAAAYGDLYFRSMLNDVARATVLVDFAVGTDIDLHGLDTRTAAHPDGVTRLTGESDETYRARIIEARAGSSAAGPDEWWLTNARTADARVKSLGLTYQGKGRLTVTVLSSEDGGVPDSAMLEAVSTKLNSADVKPQGVISVTVTSAVVETVDIVATVTLLPDAPSTLLDQMKAQAIAKHAAAQALDLDLTRFYIVNLLDMDGVYGIDLAAPATDRVADGTRAFALGTIALTLAGRAR
jgi:phage-related baseplate assembly protein